MKKFILIFVVLILLSFFIGLKSTSAQSTAVKTCVGQVNGTQCQLGCEPCAVGQPCPLMCIIIPGTCANEICGPFTPTAIPTPTLIPTQSPTPTPVPIICGGAAAVSCPGGYKCSYSDGINGVCVIPTSLSEMNVPLTGTGDFCSAMSVNKASLGGANDFIEITSTAKSGDIVSFGFGFLNLDNLDASGKPKFIMFSANKAYLTGKDVTVSSNSIKTYINSIDMDRPDLNWSSYVPKPKHIKVWGLFKNSAGVWSKVDDKCSVTFTASTIDPTPTPNATCVCSATTGTCSTTCFYDKFAVTSAYGYSNPIKCNLGADLFMSTPSQADKDKWCRNYYKTKGDADGNGKANLMDYFYYVSARSGQNLPTSVNVDFDGDGYVTDIQDRAVIMQSLKQ